MHQGSLQSFHQLAMWMGSKNDGCLPAITNHF